MKSLKPFAPRAAATAAPVRWALAALLVVTCLTAGSPARAASTGTLVAVGGGSEEPGLMREVLDLAKGKATRVVIVTTASSDPERSGPIYQKFFQALGVSKIDVLAFATRDQAFEPAALETLGAADLIYFTGGNQIRLAQTLVDTPVHGALLAAWQRGAMIAGTSAGAMVWGPEYLAAGTSQGALLKRTEGGLDLKPGLGLLPGIVIDTHFGREGRLGRLLVAAAQLPGLSGIGIDERTAAIITADGLRVIGEGRVTVLDLAHASMPAKASAVFSVRDAEMHLLSAGDALKWRRDESEKRPMLPARGREGLLASSLWLQGGDGPPTFGRGVADPSTLFSRLPEDVLILAGDGAVAAAQRWQSAIAGSGRTTVRVLTASQMAGSLPRLLPASGGVLLLDDGQGSLARVVAGEAGTQLKQAAGRIQFAMAGPAVALAGEPAMRAGPVSNELVQGLRLSPGLLPNADLWAPGAIDRLVVDALLAGGAMGIGLSDGNGVRLEGGALHAVGTSPVLVVQTDTVSLANPAGPSARDLRLHVLAPGERLAF